MYDPQYVMFLNYVLIKYMFITCFMSNRRGRCDPNMRKTLVSNEKKLNEDLISRSRDQILGSRSPWIARWPLVVWEMVRGTVALAAAAPVASRGDQTPNRG